MATHQNVPAGAGVDPGAAQPLVHRHVSFLSDYGLDDEFVGVVHSVLKALAPGVDVIDITHGIAPHDLRGGALALARSVQYMCPGVVLAVVDPGVGTDRRPVAVEVGDGSSVLIGPDNGLLAPAVSMVGGATRAVVLDNTEHHLEAPGPTFDGRDVFAPVAALVCRGMDLADLGTEIDPVSLLPGTLALSRLEADGLHAEVLWVDRFGNVQLNVDPEELDAMGPGVGGVFGLSFHGRSTFARRVGAFGSLSTGELGLIIDSYGLIAVVADQASAAEETGLSAGEEVVLAASRTATVGGPDTTGSEVPVELGGTRSHRGRGSSTDPVDLEGRG
ncbi:MAG: SAM-dependent chlorinase/fluorinase [Microthrixaceae bacterium]|nr:SAM-dependent chlorinase/fluorinase [Microthrixaceae bacterium]